MYARALAVLLRAAGVPLPSQRPLVHETRIGGMETSVFRPKAAAPGPAIVLVNGATLLGREHPRVRRLAAALAGAGHVVFVPDVPGLRLGEISEASVAGTVAAARAADGPVALLGISAGASLALLAAARPDLDSRVSVVAGLAAYTDLRDLIRLATTTGTPTTFLTLSVALSEPSRGRCVRLRSATLTAAAGPRPAFPRHELRRHLNRWEAVPRPGGRASAR